MYRQGESRTDLGFLDSCLCSQDAHVLSGENKKSTLGMQLSTRRALIEKLSSYYYCPHYYPNYQGADPEDSLREQEAPRPRYSKHQETFRAQHRVRDLWAGQKGELTYAGAAALFSLLWLLGAKGQ